jgi:enoyl-CoA hydratase/carnithine racemase
MSGHILFHPADTQGIARVVISHPGKLNALDIAMWRDLRAGFDTLRTRPRPPRVLIVQGEGGSFVAGGDIEEFPRFRFDPASLADFHEEIVAPALEAMLACDVPLIAQIEGACIGGGLEIAACCDLRLCGQGSRFGVPIAKLGFPMAPREIEIVARVVGETVLRELLLEARVLDAEEARLRGLVTRVLPDTEVAADAWRTAQRIAELSPGHAAEQAGPAALHPGPCQPARRARAALCLRPVGGAPRGTGGLQREAPRPLPGPGRPAR